MSLLDALLLEEMEYKAPASTDFIHHVYLGKRRIAAFQRCALFLAQRGDAFSGTGTADDPLRGNTDLGPPLAGTVTLASVLNVTIPTNSMGGPAIRYDVADQTLIVKLSCGTTQHHLISDDPIIVFGATGEPALNRDAYASCPASLDQNNEDNEPFLPYNPNTEFLYSFPASAPGDVAGSFYCQPWYFTVTADAPHGLRIGDAVQISGVAGASGVYFNRVHSVRSVTLTTFTCTIDNKLGDPNTPSITSGTSLTWRKVIYGVDEALKKLPHHSVLFLGEGEFETRGNRGGGGDKAKPMAERLDGQRITGSGVDVTKLRIVIAEPPHRNRNYGALSGFSYENVVDGFECSDITIDCDIVSHVHGEPYSVITKNAISVGGNHVRLRRIRAINFGPQSPASESFPISAGGAHKDFKFPVGIDCVIEECITELPGDNNVRETSCIGIGGGGFPSFSRGSGIRNCLVDSRYRDGRTSNYNWVVAVQRVSGQHRFLIKTARPHGLNPAVHRVVKLHGIRYKTGIDTSSPFTPFNDVLQIHSVISDVAFELAVPEGTDLTGSETVFSAQGSAGVQYHGAGADAGTAAFVENNRIFHTWLGYNHDTGATKDVIQAKNYMRAVQYGAFRSLTPTDYHVDQAISERNVFEAWLSRYDNLSPKSFDVGHANNAIRRAAVRENYVRSYNDIPDAFASVSSGHGCHEYAIQSNAFDLAGPEVTYVPGLHRVAILQHNNVNAARSGWNFSVGGKLAREWDWQAEGFDDFVSEIGDALFVTM